MKLDDLNTDCLLLILEQLHPIELVDIAQVSPNFAALAVNVFRRKYGSEVIISRNAGRSKKLFGIVPHTDDNRLFIDTLEFCSNVFKYFGSEIRKLVITSRFSGNDSKQIYRLINQYLSKSAIELDLGFVEKDDTFGVVPFENVENLKFGIIEQCEPTKNLSFNKLFPKLRKLAIQLHLDMDYSFIDCDLPHLESVIIGVAKGAWNKLNQINGLFRRNSQIESVVVQWSSPDYIIELSKLLPNLRNLTFLNTNIDIQNETVHFENVEMFHVMSSPFSGSLKKLAFSKLKSLTLYLYHTDGRENEWMDFFKRHQSVSQLHIHASQVPSGITFPLVEFTNDLINLTDMTFRSYSNFNFETISRFIEHHEKLTKFRFPTDEPNRSILVQHFEHDWHIQPANNSQPGILFERKIGK